METKVVTLQSPSQVGRNLALLGALGLITGAFLPWGEVEGMSISGAEGGNGKIIIGIAVVTLILLFIKKVPVWTATLIGLAVETLGILYVLDMYEAFNYIEKTTEMDLIQTIGSGLYVIIVSAALITIGSLLQFFQNRKR